MKGIILAGGHGTRLHPLTRAVSKQLLPIYDKPMVYYPLSTLILAGISDILLISTPEDLPAYKRLLGNGEHLGISMSYAEQDRPRGLAHAFLLEHPFLNDLRQGVALILGDNVFHGHGLSGLLQRAVRKMEHKETAAITVLSYVKDPGRYGVAILDQGQVTGFVEKPKVPPSNYAVTGLYFYDESVKEKASKIQPSARGELEITSLNNMYLSDGGMMAFAMPRGMVWLDTGTHDSLIEATEYVKAVEKRQGRKIGCIEEAAYRRGFIDADALKALSLEYPEGSEYKEYLVSIE